MTENPEEPTSAHMTPEEFRRNGYAVVDWIADYWAGLDARPVLSQVAPGDVASGVPASAPETGEPFERLLADLDEVVLPGVTHWQHPRFFAYFPANSSPVAVLADLVSSGLGAQGMLWSTSPAVTEIEQVVLDWLADALGLPPEFRSSGPGGGVIQDTASTATFTALLCALQRAGAGRVRQEGLGGSVEEYTVYCSTQAHSSLVKAAIMAGIGEDHVRLIEVDPETQAIRLDRLAAALEADVEAGLTPALLFAATGTTSTGAFDSVVGIGELARKYGAWLHVDAAWAGVAAVCPELRWVNEGVAGYADSYVTNPHKWLLTTFDCSAFWVRDREVLLGALSILPEYLRNAASQSGAVVDYRDWHPQLGRRFRSLKLWFVMRSYGLTGLRQHIRSGTTLAARFAAHLATDRRFELVTAVSLSLVVFRIARNGDDTALLAADADTLTKDVMDAVNAGGAAYLSHTKVNDRMAMRLAVGSLRTTEADIDLTWRAIVAAAGQVGR